MYVDYTVWRIDLEISGMKGLNLVQFEVLEKWIWVLEESLKKGTLILILWWLFSQGAQGTQGDPGEQGSPGARVNKLCLICMICKELSRGI